MSKADRRHSVTVAWKVTSALGSQATRPVVAAALLHDVGKTVSVLGTLGRFVATLAIAGAGRTRAETWNKGFRRRIALYARHSELGAEMLRTAGSEPLTIAWAREHHWPEAAWSIPSQLGRALRAADEKLNAIYRCEPFSSFQTLWRRPAKRGGQSCVRADSTTARLPVYRLASATGSNAGMFDNQTLDVTCPRCGKQVKKTVAWIKSHNEFTCSGCRNRVELDRDQFLDGLAMAEKTLRDFARNPSKRC